MSNTDQNPQDSVVFAQFEGLKNVVTRERLKPSELEAATNVDLDDAGQIRRRRGYHKVISGNFHSLYSDATGLCLAVKDGSLSLVYPNYTTVSVLSGVGSEPLDYVRVGDVVFFSSRTTSGKYDVVARTVSAWGQTGGDGTWLSPVVAPTSTLGQVNGKLLGKPPMATSLTYYAGRIYMAHGSTVWATEPWLYDYVDRTKNFLQFASDVTMLEAVTDGIYVGTEDGVDFLDGDTFPLKRTPIMNYGAIPHSAVVVPAELIKPQIENSTQFQAKNAVMFLTKSGVVAGFDSGVSYNITQSEVVLPEAQSASAMFRRQDGINSFVAVLNSGGTPTSTAAIGDHLDATIVRFNGA